MITSIIFAIFIDLITCLLRKPFTTETLLAYTWQGFFRTEDMPTKYCLMRFINEHPVEMGAGTGFTTGVIYSNIIGFLVNYWEHFTSYQVIEKILDASVMTAVTTTVGSLIAWYFKKKNLK